MHVLIIGSLTGDLGKAALLARKSGAHVDQADDVKKGLARLRAEACTDIVLCDLSHDVASLVAAIDRERMTVPVVACGTRADAEAAIRAIKAGAREFLPLPPDADLIAAILTAVAGDARPMVVHDPLMAAVLRRAEQVAQSEAGILITGESGTGKEVLARYIHSRSRRSIGPLVALNCAAIPEHLLESELFGHEKGAFTGAAGRRIGKFEAANAGTLLLDEIGEMDIRLQAKLLRALQEREIDRIGGSAPVRVDVRILATTNRDLNAEVRAGRFRADLFFRLNVVNLRMPPLRERKDDIAPLVEHFARKYAEVNGRPYRTVSTDALQLLMSHPWPGNVRELENTMHRAVLLADGGAITADAVELDPAPHGTAGGSPEVSGLVGRKVEDVERALILETLSRCLGNRTHAATILGISIRTMRNKLREYQASGLDVPRPEAVA